MAILDPTQLTFDGEQARELSEVIFENEFTNPELAQIHQIVEGIKAKKQIPYMSQINGLLGAGSGGCNPDNATNTITASEKFWEPATVSDRIGICYTDLKDSFINYGLNNGVSEADLTNVDFFNYVANVLMKYKAYEAALRTAWFGDLQAATVDDSPAGVLTSGTTLAYFNKIDGLWKQIFAIVASNGERKTIDLETKNGKSTFALQKFTSTDTGNKVVMNTLQNLLYDADYRLQEQANLVYIVTKSVQDQYARELKASNVAYTTERYENGITVLQSDGIPVIAFSLWDRIIRAYYSDGTKYYLPHRALLTTADDMMLGFDSVGALSEMLMFYDQKTKMNYIDFAVEMDAKVKKDEFIQVAY